jgi:ATP-binding cassette subfamily C protein CydD
MIDKRLYKQAQNYYLYKVMMVIYGLCSFGATLAQCWCVAQVVNQIFHCKAEFNTVLPWLYSIPVIIGLRLLVQFLAEWYFRTIALTIKKNIRIVTLNGLFANPYETRTRNSAGGQAALFCEIADTIEPFFSEFLPQVFYVIVMIPGILLCAFIYDKIAFVIMLLTVPLLPFFLSLIGKTSLKANENRLQSLKRLGSSFMDSLNGLKTLKLFGQSKNHGTYIKNRSESFRTTTMDVLKISFLSAFVLELVATISIALLAVSFGLRLLYSKMEFFDAFLLLLLAPELYLSIRQLGAKYHTAMNAKGAADALLQVPEVISNISFVKELDADKRSTYRGNISDIECNNVTVSYPGASLPSLDDVSIILPQGKLSVIVGRSGAGKSTLAGVILRMIPSTKGCVTIGGFSIDHYSKKDFYQLISYVPQRPFILQDSLLENIRFVKPEASIDDVRDALSKASLSELENVLPEGLRTIISEDGGSISRGQAQRLSLARAFLKDSPIVILDEPTSALDEGNEENATDAISKLAINRTVVVIAHRIAVIEKADLIYVLDKGRVVESGSPKDLLKSSNLYSAFNDSWITT